MITAGIRFHDAGIDGEAASPLTRPASMHARTTASNIWRKQIAVAEPAVAIG